MAEGQFVQNSDGSWSQLTQLTGSYQKLVTIANAVTITTTSLKTYNIITDGGMREEQIRQYKRFKVSFQNTHDQAATVFVYTAFRPLDLINTYTAGLLYTESNILTASGRLLIQDKAGGTGAGATIKTVPALEGVHSNLIINVQFAIAPTTGSLTIMVEMD